MHINRDLNAAINILNWEIQEINTAGIAGIYACGDASVGDDSVDSSRHALFEAGIIPLS